MQKFVFPYGIKLTSNGKIITSPTLSAYFRSEKKKIFTLLLVDSGAETTLLTREDAIALGINLEKGERTLIGGIAPLVSIFGHRHQLEIEINSIKFNIPVIFADSNEVPRVLGREGIFDKFFILFDEKEKQTIFILRDSDSEKKLKPILFEN